MNLCWTWALWLAVYCSLADYTTRVPFETLLPCQEMNMLNPSVMTRAGTLDQLHNTAQSLTSGTATTTTTTTNSSSCSSPRDQVLRHGRRRRDAPPGPQLLGLQVLLKVLFVVAAGFRHTQRNPFKQTDNTATAAITTSGQQPLHNLGTHPESLQISQNASEDVHGLSFLS